jgi:predicted nucleic acid-binding protein
LIYLDSRLLIYLVQRHPLWAASLDREIAAFGTTQFATSPLVMSECLVLPFKAGDATMEVAFRAAFARFAKLELVEDVYVDAARLRARSGLKLPDALHLACAQHHGCTALWTNDQRFGAAGDGLVRVVTP